MIFKTISREVNSVTPETVNTWKETSLPTLMSNCELKDIYNANKFGIFYICVINKAYQFKSGKSSGGKLSRVPITDITGVNATGYKIPISVCH